MRVDQAESVGVFVILSGMNQIASRQKPSGGVTCSICMHGAHMLPFIVEACQSPSMCGIQTLKYLDVSVFELELCILDHLQYLASASAIQQ